MILSEKAMSKADRWMQMVQQEVDALPLPAVQLVGALVAREGSLPVSVRSWVITLLGRRIDMSTVSPAAEAVLRICEFKRHSHSPQAQAEIQAQLSLLRSLNLVGHLEQATQFVRQLIDRYNDYVTQDPDDPELPTAAKDVPSQLH